MTKDEALKLALDWLESGTFVYPTTLGIAIKKALVQPEQEQLQPVWSGGPTNKDVEDAMRLKRLNQLATSPKRGWVGLRDDEIYSVLENLQVMHHRPPTTDSRVIFAQAIEAKLKEKNT